MYVPYQLERLLLFGVLLCFDSFLVRNGLFPAAAYCWWPCTHLRCAQLTCRCVNTAYVQHPCAVSLAKLLCSSLQAIFTVLPARVLGAAVTLCRWLVSGTGKRGNVLAVRGSGNADRP